MEIVILRIESYCFKDCDDSKFDSDNRYIGLWDTRSHLDYAFARYSGVKKAKRWRSSHNNGQFFWGANPTNAHDTHSQYWKRAKIWQRNNPATREDYCSFTKLRGLTFFLFNKNTCPSLALQHFFGLIALFFISWTFLSEVALITNV